MLWIRLAGTPSTRLTDSLAVRRGSPIRAGAPGRGDQPPVQSAGSGFQVAGPRVRVAEIVRMD